jgi:hypothetical protein
MRLNKYPCEDFCTATVQAFDNIAAARPANCESYVVSALLDSGLIRRSVQVVGIDSLGPILRYKFVTSSARLPDNSLPSDACNAPNWVTRTP